MMLKSAWPILKFGERVIINKSMKKIKLLVIAVVIIAGSLFMWQYVNNFLSKSRAGAENALIFFEKNQMNVAKEGAVEVNFFLATLSPPAEDPTPPKVSAVKATIIYPANLLEYYPTPEGQVESHCDNFKLTKIVSVSNRLDQINKSLGYLTISRTAMTESKDLPFGLFCFGTIVFKPKTSGEGKITFSEVPIDWEIIGPGNAFTPSFDKSKSSISIKIGQAGQMCNTSCLTDSDCGGAGLVCYKEGWPDTCPPLPSETLGKLKKGQTLPSENINELAQICPLAKDQLKLKLNGMPTILKGVCRNSQCPTASVADCQCAIQNKINWKTDHVSLKADDFYIIANGKKFIGDRISLRLHSDPPDPPSENYTTLEAEWKENNQEMRLYIYFYKNDKSWWSDEMRTYDNNVPDPDWITYKGKYFESPLGQTWKGKAVLFGSENGGSGQIYFLNPQIQAFLKSDFPKPTCIPRLKCMDMTPPCNPIVIPGTVFCPKLTPTPSPVCQKSQGDANCIGGIDLADFEIWRKEFTGELTTKTADFNDDTKVSLADFEVWRKSYYK